MTVVKNVSHNSRHVNTMAREAPVFFRSHQVIRGHRLKGGRPDGRRVRSPTGRENVCKTVVFGGPESPDGQLNLSGPLADVPPGLGKFTILSG